MKCKAFSLKVKISVLLLLLFAAGVAGLWYIKSQTFTQNIAALAAEEASRFLATDVKIDGIKIENVNSLRLEGLVVQDKQGEVLLTAESARVHFSPLALWQEASPLKGIDEITVQAPTLMLKQRANGVWNYEDILSAERKKSSDFSGKIRVDNGTVTGELAAGTLTLTDIAGIVDFAKYPSLHIKAAFTQNGAAAEISATVGSQRQFASLTGENFALTDYLPFLPENMLPDVTIQAGTVKKLTATIAKDDGDAVKVNGQAELEGGAAVFMDKTAADIKALLVFNEKEVRVFSHALVEEQPLAVHGKLRFDTGAMYMNLIAQSPGFKPERLIAGIPYAGEVSFTANITGTMAEPSVTGEFKAKNGEADGYAFQNAKAKVKFSQNHVFVDELTAEIFGGTIRAQGQLALSDMVYNGQVKAVNLDAAACSEFLPEVQGRIGADIGFNGQGRDLEQAEVYGSLSMNHGSYQAVGFQQMQASFYKNNSRITVDALSADLSDGGAFSLEGSVAGDAINLDFRGQHVDLSLLQQFVPQADVSGSADFSGRLRGSRDNPKVRLDFSAAEGVLFQQPYHRIQGSAGGSLNGVYIHDFSLENGGRVTHTASGIIGFTGAKKLDLKIETKGARMEDLAALLLPEQPITGNVDNSLHLTGSVDDMQAQGHIHFYEGSYRGVLLTGADGDYTRQNGLTTLRDFYIQSPLINLRLSGVMDKTENLDFSVQAEDIHLDKLDAHLPYPVSGTAKFAGKIRGSLSLPVFSGALQAEALELNGQKLHELAGDVEYSNHALTLNKFAFRQNGGSFDLTGRIDTVTTAVAGSLKVKSADVNAMLAVANYKNDLITGRLDGTIDFGGTFANPAAHVQGYIDAGTLKGYPLSHIMLDVSLQNRILTLHKFYGEQGIGKVAAEGDIDLDGPISARLSAQDISAGLLMHLMDSDVDMQGTLNVDAQFAGTLANPAADVSVDVVNGGVGAATFDSLTGLLNLKNGIINVNQVLLKKGPYKASAYGTVPLRALQSKPWEMPDDYEQINLRVGLDQADLSVLPMLSSQVDWAMGPLKGGVTITGTLAHPFINGGVRLSDGAIKFKQLKNPLQNMQVDIDFKNDRMTVNKFSGLMGGGTYGLTGSTLVTGGGFAQYDFKLVLDKLGIDCDFYQGPLSGEFALNTGEIFGHALPKLAGNLTIANAMVTIPSVPDTEGNLPNMIIDIGLNVGEKVRLYSPFLYDLSLKGSAHFGGTTRHPQPSGEIAVTRGKISYLKTVFEVRDAVAYFNQVDSFLPMIHLGADTKLNQTKVYFTVDGPANNMGIKLTSDSEMSDSELLQLLTLRSRYRPANASDNGTSDLAALFDIGLRMSFLSAVDNIMRNTMQVDEFNIVRDTLSSAGSAGNKTSREVYNVEIGKYLSDKYMLKYTKGIGYSNNKIGIQYELNDHIGLSGSTSSRDGFTIGLEARFNF